MSDVELQVENLTIAPTKGDFRGHFRVKQPGGGQLQIIGWAFSRYGNVASIEVTGAQTVIANTVPRIRRPDVSEAFPSVDAAGTSGFELSIEASGSGRSNLEVDAVMMDGARHSLGWITVLVSDRRWGDLS